MCGGSSAPAAQTQVSEVKLDPRMNAALYGDESGTKGLYGLAERTFVNRTPEQSVAGFNPLQQYAMTNLVNGITGGKFGATDTNNAAIAKLLGGAGLQYQPQSFNMPAFDTSQLFKQRVADTNLYPGVSATIFADNAAKNNKPPAMPAQMDQVQSLLNGVSGLNQADNVAMRTPQRGRVMAPDRSY